MSILAHKRLLLLLPIAIVSFLSYYLISDQQYAPNDLASSSEPLTKDKPDLEKKEARHEPTSYTSEQTENSNPVIDEFHTKVESLLYALKPSANDEIDALKLRHRLERLEALLKQATKAHFQTLAVMYGQILGFDENTNYDAISVFFKSWGTVDPQVALDFARTYVNGDVSVYASTDIIRSWKNAPSDELLKYYPNLPNWAREEYVDTILSRKWQDTPEGADKGEAISAWIESMTDSEAREFAYTNHARIWSEEEPQKALEWSVTQKAMDKNRSDADYTVPLATLHALQNWTSIAPQEALAWSWEAQRAGTFGTDSDILLLQTIGNIARMNPHAAIDAIAETEGAYEKQLLAVGFAETAYDMNPIETLSVLDHISDLEVKEYFLKQTLNAWHETAPQQMGEWIRENPLPDGAGRSKLVKSATDY